MIDLLGNTLFTDTDITRRTEAIVRSVFTAEAEVILNRKLQGMAMGLYVLTADEQAELAQFRAVLDAARAAGTQARADNALLAATLAYEAALARLDLPRLADTEPATIDATDEAGNSIILPNPAVAQDNAERAAAQAVVEGVTAEVLALVQTRASVVIVEP